MSVKKIGFCGLDCAECPAYHAAERFTIEERQKTADLWSKQFNTTMRAGDVDCTGCTETGGQHVGYCAVCQIRLCGLEKKIAHCAACPDYGCEKLSGFHQMAPQAKTNLEVLRG
jgi:hypothetical protein